MTNEEIIAVIEDGLKRRGTTPGGLAKEAGFSVNAVRYILEGRSPSSRRLADVCEALGLEFYVGLPRVPSGGPFDAKQLASELERLAFEARQLAERSDTSVQIDQATPYVSAPRYEVLAAAGTGSPVSEEVVTGHLGFSRKWLRDQQLMAGKLAVIEVDGDSMEPTLHGGDVVLLDMAGSELRDGEIYTLRRGDDLLVKRVRQHEAGWLIVSDNVSYPVEPLDPEVDVVGKVVWLGRTLGRKG